MAARYRVERRAVAVGFPPWTVVSGAQTVAYCVDVNDANLVASALNAEPRLRAALECLVDFITDIRASGDCGYFEPNARPGERFYQAARAALMPDKAGE